MHKNLDMFKTFDKLFLWNNFSRLRVLADDKGYFDIFMTFYYATFK